jgi:putative hydrolase of HD superfamily
VSDPADEGDPSNEGSTSGEGDDLDAVLEALSLKDETRTGWQLRGVAAPESVADHSWGVSLLCLLYGPRAGVDVDRALRLAVVHDVAEARTGDVPTRVDPNAPSPDPEAKERRERAALKSLLAPFDDGLRDVWEEYESRETPEARFVKDMDLVDMCAQAVRYEREGRYDPDADDGAFEAYDHLDEFFATAAPRVRTDVGRDLFERLRSRYEAVRDAE